MDLSLRASAASGLADAEVMEQNLQEWIIHRCVDACVRGSSDGFGWYGYVRGVWFGGGPSLSSS